MPSVRPQEAPGCRAANALDASVAAFVPSMGAVYLFGRAPHHSGLQGDWQGILRPGSDCVRCLVGDFRVSLEGAVAASVWRMRTDCLFGGDSRHGCLPLNWLGFPPPGIVYPEAQRKSFSSPGTSVAGIPSVMALRALPSGSAAVMPSQTVQVLAMPKAAAGAGEPQAALLRERISSEGISSPSCLPFSKPSSLMTSSLSVAGGHPGKRQASPACGLSFPAAPPENQLLGPQ